MPLLARCEHCSSKFKTDQNLAQHIAHKRDCETYYSALSDRFARSNRAKDNIPAVDDLNVADMAGPPSPEFGGIPMDFLPDLPALIPDIRRSPSVDVEDLDRIANTIQRYIRCYPKSKQAGFTLGFGLTKFEKLREEREGRGESHWSPFESQDEYELAEWLLKNVN